MNKTVIYYAPHADDETLHMSVGIRSSIDAGDRVIAVLLTDGSATGSLEIINGSILCSWHNCTHNPYEEKFLEGPLNRMELAYRRSVEFHDACLALGVKEENIIILGIPDGKLTKELAEAVILGFLDKYPDAAHRTVTYITELEVHNDHLALGNALLGLVNSGKINDTAFYINRYYWGRLKGDMVNFPRIEQHAGPSQAPYIRAAIDVYKRWDPSHGNYGVGYHSVASVFDAMLSDMTCIYHLPNIERSSN